MEYNNYDFENPCMPNMCREHNMMGYEMQECPCIRCQMMRYNVPTYPECFRKDSFMGNTFGEFPFVMPRVVSVDPDELF
ncbi:hypothetical protein [Clostridium hydrogenum]|uniref:hypothetical protein n=1 Tax=Clostridium hydrogenum TaxID=2855764 RepID=UPI001F34F73F|nr:hypothetical protein [Clostridium hydrogenum]